MSTYTSDGKMKMSGHTWSVATQLNIVDCPAFTLKQVVANEGLELGLRLLKKPTLGMKALYGQNIEFPYINVLFHT